PPETEGVGACASGTQTCEADGMSWGPCEDEVLPAAESCALPGDEDCDGEALACSGDALWARGYGSWLHQFARSITSDANGELGLLVKLEGGVATIDFGGGELGGEGNASARHAALARLDGDAGHLWSQSFMFSAHLGDARSVRFDAAGNVYLAGSYNGGVDFGAEGLYGGPETDVYLAKFDPGGTNLWARDYGDDGAQSLRALEVNPDGDAILCGSFEVEIDFDGPPLFATGTYDVFLAAIDGDGGHLWSKRFGDSALQYCQGLGVDAIGGVTIAVETHGDIKFGPETLVNAGGSDLALARFDQGGAHEWSRIVGNSASQVLWHAAGGADGSMVVTGYTIGPTDFGDGPVDTGNNSDVFLVRYDDSGALAWANRYPRTGGERINAVALDGAGHVLMGGEFTDEIDWGGGPLGNGNADWDGFASKLAPDGAHVWTHMFSDADEAYATQRVADIAAAADDTVLITGEFWRSVSIGGVELLTEEDPMYRDVFAAKLAP
ncbi:MAG: hypothetical protein KC468_37765, partial [Myxococcales bacterium]|nr:hypothetical protein [Myxococcales bacterium]